METLNFDVPSLLVRLQFPDSDDNVLMEAVHLLPYLSIGLDVAAVTRMLVLAPSVLPQRLTNVFATVIRARLAIDRRKRIQSDGFLEAVLSGIVSARSSSPVRSLCATVGLISLREKSAASEFAFADNLAMINVDDISRDPEQIQLIADLVTSAFPFLSPRVQGRIPTTLAPLILRALLYGQQLQTIDHNQDLKVLSKGNNTAPLARLLAFLLTRCDSQQCLEILTTLSLSTVVIARGNSNMKDFAFACVAALAAVADSLQVTSRTRETRNDIRVIVRKCAIIAIQILRDLSSTIYTLSVAGFASHLYTHSSFVGLLIAGDFNTASTSSYLYNTLEALAAEICGSPMNDYEMLFALNTAEYVVRAVIAEPSASSIESHFVEAFVASGKNIVISRPWKSQASSIETAIHEAAHSVVLASLSLPVLAHENAIYLSSLYLPKILELVRANPRTISLTQFRTAISAICRSLSPGAGIMISAVPHFAEQQLLPALLALAKGEYEKSEQDPLSAVAVNAFIDAVLICALPETIPRWLDALDRTAASRAIAERLRHGEVPTSCASAIMDWWFRPNL
ncbi:hypothetical protein V1511DRAFT_243970 [Dipodascopsis uninucleata]